MTNRLPQLEPYTPTGKTVSIGLDAVDALMCFGFQIVKTSCTGNFVLCCYNHVFSKAEWESIEEIFAEIKSNLAYHDNLITQKGNALET
jgi:hypothetical protein